MDRIVLDPNRAYVCTRTRYTRYTRCTGHNCIAYRWVEFLGIIAAARIISAEYSLGESIILLRHSRDIESAILLSTPLINSILYVYRRVPILLPFSISGFRNFGDFWLFSNNFATTREVGTPMRCVRCCLKLFASFDIWWSYTYEEQIGCKSRSKIKFRSLAIEFSRFWGAQIENWIGSVTKINMLFPNPLSHLCEISCPRS